MVTGISRLWSEIETLSTSSYLQTHQIFRILSVYLVFFWQSIRPVTEVGNYSELAVRILTWNSSEGQQCGLEQTDRLSPDTTMQNIKGKDNLVCCIKPRLVTCPLGELGWWLSCLPSGLCPVSRLLKSMLRKTWAVSSGIPLTSLRQSQPSMRFECVVVAGSPGYLNFPPIFVFYERDSGAMLS